MATEGSAAETEFPFIKNTRDGVSLHIRVRPKAARTEWVDSTCDPAQLRVAAPPIDGEANAACVAFLARTLGVRRADIRLVSGAKARVKRFDVSGLRRADAVVRLRDL